MPTKHGITTHLFTKALPNMFFFIKTCETLKRKSCSGKDLMPYIILMHNNQVAYTKEQIATKHRITTHLVTKA